MKMDLPFKNGKLKYQAFYINGKPHNENGQLECEEYWTNGQRDNLSGPAYQIFDKQGKLLNKEFWINGKHLSKDDFLKQTQKCPEPKIIVLDGKTYKLTLIE